MEYLGNMNRFWTKTDKNPEYCMYYIKDKKGGEIMRIPNLIMQGLIAGAVLFIPAEVFAEKGNAEEHKDAAVQNSQAGQNHTTVSNQPQKAQPDRKPDLPVQAAKKKEVKQHAATGSVRSNQVRASSPERKKSAPNQSQRPSVKEEKNIHSRHENKNVPSKSPDVKPGKMAKPIHKKPSLKLKTVNSLKGSSVSFSEKKKEKETGVKQAEKTEKIPQKVPYNKVPDYPASKVIPAPAGQTSSHSTSASDGGSGVSAASFKASMALPLIFEGGQKVDVYFGRLDLLRSQWVNAPPAQPPESAL
jgi:hypothetical protein